MAHLKKATTVIVKDERGDGAETMAQENTPLSREDHFECPEKDPGRNITKMKRISGETQPLGSKVTTAPSHG